MRALAVAYIHCTVGELRDRSVFEEAARFTRWECTVTIRCDDTGEDLQVSCTPPGTHVQGTTCWGWRYFAERWERKNGPIR